MSLIDTNTDSNIKDPEDTDGILGDLMDMEYTYPEVIDPEFHKKIYEKREFYYHKIPGRSELKEYQDIKEYRDDVCSRKFALQEHQSLLSNFINPDTPYKGVLVFHGTGTGKTCAGITIAEKFKPLIQKYNTKIYILMSGPLIKENWKSELLKCTGETYLKQPDATVFVGKQEKDRAKKAAINAAMQYYRFITYKSFNKKVLGEKIRIKDQKGYRKTEKGEYERDVSIDKINSLDNTLIIADEAHNLTGNSWGEALKKIIDNSVNLKVVLLSATPMKNYADDIVELINFLRPKDAPIERNIIYDSNKNYRMKFKEGGAEYLKKMATGYISYLRGADPLTFAKRVERGTVPPGLLFTKVTRCRMLPFQQRYYDKAVQNEEGDTLDRTSTAVANFAFPGLKKESDKITGYHGLDGISTVKGQIRSNKESINKSLAKMLTKDKKSKEHELHDDFIRVSDDGKSVSGQILHMKYLKNFSIKFYKAIKKLNRLVWGKKGAKTAFIYSNLVQVGVNTFSEILIQNGYLEYDEDVRNYKIMPDTVCYYCGFTHQQHITDNLIEDAAKRKENKISESSTDYEKKSSKIPTHKFHPSTFISITGKSSEEGATEIIPEDKVRIVDTVFNNISNRHGKHIKFVLGSPVMKEGINLRNVAEVHILDVYFTLGKVDQVIGRAIRHCSHYDVTTDTNRYPEVKVYKYVVSLESGLSTEELLYKKAERKHLLIKKTERALKEIAIDCPLNMHGNVFPEDVSKFEGCTEHRIDKKDKDKEACPALCDYMQCQYKCDNDALNKLYWDDKNKIYKKISKDNLDYSTFNKSLARGEIESAKSRIKDMYRIEYVYTLKDIVSFVKATYDDIGEKKDLFDEFFVFQALNELAPVTENDFNNFADTVYDKYNRSGYLIYIDGYYIYQPFDQNTDVPMYYRTTYDKPLTSKLTLYNYLTKSTDKYRDMIGVSEDTEISTKDTDYDTYDFDSVMEYYDNRDEFKYVGIIDKEPARRQNKRVEILKDVFKIRERRKKILDKKRGIGIQSMKGSVCESNSKEYLNKVTKYLKIKFTGKESRAEVCQAIKDRLLFLERFGTKGRHNKMTYIMIPANHKVYNFPYNLEDRAKQTVKKIKDRIKIDLDISLQEKKQTIGTETDLPMFIITIKHNKSIDKFTKFIESLGGHLTDDKKQWVFEFK